MSTNYDAEATKIHNIMINGGNIFVHTDDYDTIGKQFVQVYGIDRVKSSGAVPRGDFIAAVQPSNNLYNPYLPLDCC